MFDPRVEFLINHHPLWFSNRQPLGSEGFDYLERPKLPPSDGPLLTEYDERSRTILDIFGLGFAALVVIGLFVLAATAEVGPPSPTVVADMPSGER